MSRPFGGLAISAALLLMCHGPDDVLAQDLRLSWNDCGDAGAQDKQDACDSQTSRDLLYGTFRLPFGIERLQQMIFKIDVVTTVPLTPWWDLGSGGCRAGSWFISTLLPGSSCGESFPSFANLKFTQISSSRLEIIGEMWPSSEVAIPAETEFYAFTLGIRHNLIDVCDGCCVPACIAWTQMLVQDAAAGWFAVSDADGFNWVGWQGATVSIPEPPGQGNPCTGSPSAACGVTLARPSTWGSIKTLYR